MKIIYLHQYFVPPEGSGGSRSLEMARRLIKQGHKVTMITSCAAFPSQYKFKKLITDLEIDGIVLKVIKVPYSNKFSYPKRILAFIGFSFLASIVSLMIKDVDVVFATSTPLTIAIPGVIAKLWQRCPMVFEVRDLWPELPIAVGALKNPLLVQAAKLLERFAYRNSERIVALSPGMKEGVVRTGFSADKIHVIPNSCDVQAFQVPETAGQSFLKEHHYLQGGPLITYAGTIGIINGVEYIVHLAKAMMKIDPSVHFLMVGDGIRKNQVIQEARILDLRGKNVWFLPQVPKINMPSLMAATTVAVSTVINLPELWHNSANKFFDSLAAGRPIMINYDGWQAELLEETGAGLVVPVNDPVKGAEILYDFLKSPDRLDLARKAALELATTRFNRQLHAKQLEKVFKLALGML